MEYFKLNNDPKKVPQTHQYPTPNSLYTPPDLLSNNSARYRLFAINVLSIPGLAILGKMFHNPEPTLNLNWDQQYLTKMYSNVVIFIFTEIKEKKKSRLLSCYQIFEKGIFDKHHFQWLSLDCLPEVYLMKCLVRIAHY